MSFLDQITPVILTYNEEANIGRCLSRLSWARDIVVVDSLSDDATLRICAEHPNVRVFSRKFDQHARQWSFAIEETGISTPWVLALDADYMVSDDAIAEMSALAPDDEVGGYRVSFLYAINGAPLRSGVYPPVTALYRLQGAAYLQDGHSQRIVTKGAVGRLNAPFLHDDRKSLTRWIWAQARYAALEAEKLQNGATGLKALLRRRTPLSPLAMAAYCLFIRGGILEGRAGWLYAMQRWTAESLICAAYNDLKLRSRAAA